MTNTGEPGTDPKAPTDVVVRRNKVSHAQLAGLHFGPGTAGLLADRNTALDNGEVDCRDVSTLGGPPGTGTAGTANTWQGNVGASDEPHGICSPPVADPDDHGKGHGKKHKKHKKNGTARTRAAASGTTGRSDRGAVLPAQRSRAWRARVRRVERP